MPDNNNDVVDSRTSTLALPRSLLRYTPAELELRLDQAWRVLNGSQEMVRSADQKVYLLVVMSTILVSFAANNLDSILKLGRTQSVLLMVFLGVSGFFYFFALRTLVARAASAANTNITTPATNSVGLIFFGDIASHGSATKYASDMRNADLHDVLEDVLEQAYQVACIAQAKFLAYKRAWYTLICEVALFLTLEFSTALKWL
jgi:Family of unknown function (DUF5706)